jgi:Rrf2 family protein
MVLEMARRYHNGAIQLGQIANQQNISLKYLEQIIRPLKKANYIKSFRGAKGGHMLNKPPGDITVGEIVALLEGGNSLIQCDREPNACERVDKCVTRFLWREAAKAMFERLSAITFADLLSFEPDECEQEITDRF